MHIMHEIEENCSNTFFYELAHITKEIMSFQLEAALNDSISHLF